MLHANLRNNVYAMIAPFIRTILYYGQVPVWPLTVLISLTIAKFNGVSDHYFCCRSFFSFVCILLLNILSGYYSTWISYEKLQFYEIEMATYNLGTEEALTTHLYQFVMKAIKDGKPW